MWCGNNSIPFLSAKQLQNSVVSILRNLGLKNANFSIQFSECKPSGDGIDDINFLFSANPDQKLAPLSNFTNALPNSSTSTLGIFKGSYSYVLSIPAT